MTLNNSFYWEYPISGFSYGDYETNAYAMEANWTGIINTGSPVIYTPAYMGTALIDMILAGHSAYSNNGYYFTECDAVGFDSVYFRIDEYWFEVSPS